MEKSSSIVNIAKSLIEFSAKVTKIKKDATNPFLGKRYASLSNILDQVAGPLRECGLALVQMPSGEAGLTSILMHGESGEFIQDTCEIKNLKEDAQLRGSHITYLRRYALCAILALNIDDEGGNESAPAGQSQKGRQSDLPWLNKGTMLDEALKEWLSGNTDFANIKAKFRLSKAVEADLKAGFVEGMKKKVSELKTLQELTDLYNMHKASVGQGNDLLDVFANRKKELSGKPT